MCLYCISCLGWVAHFAAAFFALLFLKLYLIQLMC